MGVVIEWVRFSPKTELRLDVTGGSLTLGSASKLVNYADYGWDPAQVVGTIFKNGTSAGAVSINTSTGALTASAVSVATSDEIEVRLEYTGRFSWPYHNKMISRRSAFWTVPAGTNSIEFDDGHNKQPVPDVELGFGWDASDNLKVGVKVAAADGASQSMALFTRRLPSAQSSSSTISLSNTTSIQTHTSEFDKSEITGDFEIEWVLDSASGNPRQQDRVRLVFSTKALVPSYPPDFPGSDVSMVQLRSNGKLKLGAPGQ